MKPKLQKFSAGGVVVHDGQVLLIKWLSHHTFDFPKGTIEEGETTQETAVREVKEETGYDARILDDLGTVTFEFDWKDGLRYEKTVAYYLMELASEDAPAPNREADEDFENYWVTIEQAAATLSFSEARDVLERALKSPKFPV